MAKGGDWVFACLRCGHIEPVRGDDLGGLRWQGLVEGRHIKALGGDLPRLQVVQEGAALGFTLDGQRVPAMGKQWDVSSLQ